MFGEGDEELQHAVVRLLRQQDKTLATLEWGTSGLVAHWLGDVAGAEGFYAGGLTVTTVKSLKAGAGISFAQSATGRERIKAMAEACRQRFEADYGLAVGPLPVRDSDAPRPEPVLFGLASADGVRVKEITFAGHPATLTIYCAKHALNLARLALLNAA